MPELLTAALSAFGVMFLAELGDKTQLLALGFGARHRLPIVATGLALGFAAAGAVASIVGGVLGAALPERPLALAGGALFLAFAVWTLRGGDDDDDDDDVDAAAGVPRGTGMAVVGSIALSIAVAEMGDKTQLATATLAAQSHPVGVWIGATLGEVAAAMVGALVGRRVGAHLPEHAIRIGSAALFAAFGVFLLWSAI